MPGDRQLGQLGGPGVHHPLHPVLLAVGGRIPQVLAGRDRPAEVGHPIEPSLQPSLTPVITQQHGLLRRDGDSLPVDGIERAGRVADHQEPVRPVPDLAVVVSLVGRLPVDRDVARPARARRRRRRRLDQAARSGSAGELVRDLGSAAVVRSRWRSRASGRSRPAGRSPPRPVAGVVAMTTPVAQGRRAGGPIEPAGVAEMRIDQLGVRQPYAEVGQPVRHPRARDRRRRSPDRRPSWRRPR